MSTTELQVYELLKKRFSEEEARIVLQYIEEKGEEKINQKKDVFLTKDDKVDIMRSIYLVGIVQFLAIVGSVLAILSFSNKWFNRFFYMKTHRFYSKNYIFLIKDDKVDLIKWMVGFWIAQMAVIIGLYLNKWVKKPKVSVRAVTLSGVEERELDN